MKKHDLKRLKQMPAGCENMHNRTQLTIPMNFTQNYFYALLCFFAIFHDLFDHINSFPPETAVTHPPSQLDRDKSQTIMGHIYLLYYFILFVAG